MPPTCGGPLRRRRGRPVLGRTRVTKTTEIGTVIRPRRSVTLPARADGSPDVRRRACWVGADAGRAIRATGATSRGISMADGWGELPTATGAAPMAAKPPS